MEEERFLQSRGSLEFLPESPPRPAPAELAPPRPSPPILEHFRAMLRDREDLMASSDADDEPPPPTTGEIVRLYEEVLSQLTCNSKPIITELTIIAGEQREHAEWIADAICARILEVPVDLKLPSFYLLDSIVKNIGREYMRHFAARLPKVFCEAYNQVHSSLHPAMRHLFGTWSQVFPSSVLRKIEDKLQFSRPENQQTTDLVDTRHSESPSPRPSHGIHINPRYLEARSQLEHSAADVQHLKGVSSNLQGHGKKSFQYGDYDFDHTKIRPPWLGMARASPQTAAVHASSMVGLEGSLPCSKSRASRPSSSPRIGLRRSISPPDDRFERDISPGRPVERTSPSHSGLEFLPGRVTNKNRWIGRRWPSDDGAQQREDSIGSNLNNGYSKQRSRELIDAYGNYKGKGIIYEKHPKVQRLDVNGINCEAASRECKSSEEEEYGWEDMSPTLANRSSRNNLQSFGPFSRRDGFNIQDDRLLEPDFRSFGGVLQSGHGSMNKKFLDGTRSQNESLLHYQNSYHVQELGKLSNSFPQYSQQSLSPRLQGRVLQTPFSVSGIIPSIGQKLPSSDDNLLEAEVPFRRLPIVHSGTLNGDTSTTEKYSTQRLYSPRVSPELWPPIHRSRPLPLVPIPPNQKQFRTFDILEGNKPVLNQRPNSSLFLPRQQYDPADRTTTNASKPLQLPYHHSGLFNVNQQNQEVGTTRIQSQEAHGSLIPPAPAQFSSRLVPQPLNHVQRGQGVVMGSDFSNRLSYIPSSVGMHAMSDTSLNEHSGVLPPLLPGPPPVSSHLPASQNISSITSSSPAIAFSGLINTLMAQGLISLTHPGQSQGSVGVEFDAEVLKVRHESTIIALYSDLPRQCTTCGLRFKCQEEHSNHMDWHVTKNRISKSRKQKPSRKWFVNAKEWLSGGETLGADVVPGFLHTESVSEKNEDTEMAVPADENQNMCALCGEPFEDFYSDENEEWMYKGAVYMNAPNGNIEGLYRSQLGPIVHAKCRSESSEDIR